MRKWGIIFILLLAYGMPSSLFGISFQWKSRAERPQEANCATGLNTVWVDGRGVWNIYPNYTGFKVSDAYKENMPARFVFGYSPADTSYCWLDGHLFSILDADGRQIIRVDLVRRGRFRLTCGDTSALSRFIFWEPTVIHWNNLKPEKLELILGKENVALVRGGYTTVKAKGGNYGKAPYSVRFGRLGLENRGALGWYSSLEIIPGDAPIPPETPFPGNQDYAERIQKLNDFFYGPQSMQAIPEDNAVQECAAQWAAGRLAVDGLWYRQEKKNERNMELFLKDAEALMEELKTGTGLRAWRVPSNYSTPMLGEDDTDFYGGVCGWGLGSLAPELKAMGYNLVSAHVWPDSVMRRENGIFDDGMLRRRTMPHLEEYENHGIRFDLMVAPYTPPHILRNHPEWEGTFVGMGMEGEEEGIALHEQQWKGRQAGHGFLKASILAPDYLEMCREFLSQLLPIVSQSPALAAIDLANEVCFEDYTPAMQQRFRQFLQKKYVTIDKVNAAWKTRFESFDRIFMTRDIAMDRNNAVRFWDWVLCNQEVGTEFFTMMHDLCVKYAPGIPTHIKHLPYEFGMPWMPFASANRNFYDYADGIDRKALAALTPIIGTDSWADNSHDRADRLSSDVAQYQTPYFELLRSYEPGKWIFDSEWHIIRCDPPVTPPACLDMVMRQNFIHGLRAGAFWVACPGINQALDMTSQPHLMLQGGLTTASLRMHSKAYLALANRPRRIGVLYSRHSRYLDGDRNNTALLRISEAAMFAGSPLRVVDERQLIEGSVTAANLPLLLVSDCPMPLPETEAALKKYATEGGKLLFDTCFGSDNARMASEKIGGKNLALSRDLPELSKQLRSLAKDYGLADDIEVVDSNGASVYGVEWVACRSDDGKAYLYIANMSKQAVTLKVKGASELLDIRTEKKHPPAEMHLPIWASFIGTYR